MTERSKTLHSLWIIMIVIGGLITVGSIAAGILSVIFMQSVMGPNVVMLVGVSSAGVILGTALLVGAFRGARAQPGNTVFSKWLWLLWLLISGIALVAGMMLPASAQTHWSFGVLHMAGMLFPALLVIGLLTRFMAPVAVLNWRQALVGILGGATGILVAFPVELIGLFASGVLIVALATLVPGGMEEVTRLTSLLESWQTTLMTDTTFLSSAFLSPLTVLIMGITLSIVTPLIEELSKVLILAFVGGLDRGKTSHLSKRERLARAYMWGAVCGLGFAILEGVTNGALGLGVDGGWVSAVLTRALATTMHVFVSGLVGLGWGLAREYKWWWLPVMYSLAVVLHGLWNANVIILLEGSLLQEQGLRTGAILSTAGIGVQLLLAIMVCIGFVAIPAALKEKPVQADPAAV